MTDTDGLKYIFPFPSSLLSERYNIKLRVSKCPLWKCEVSKCDGIDKFGMALLGHCSPWLHTPTQCSNAKGLMYVCMWPIWSTCTHKHLQGLIKVKPMQWKTFWPGGYIVCQTCHRVQLSQGSPLVPLPSPPHTNTLNTKWNLKFQGLQYADTFDL